MLATADGLGTMAIMRRTRKSKPYGWRWQGRFTEGGADGLLRDQLLNGTLFYSPRNVRTIEEVRQRS